MDIHIENFIFISTTLVACIVMPVSGLNKQELKYNDEEKWII